MLYSQTNISRKGAKLALSEVEGVAKEDGE